MEPISHHVMKGGCWGIFISILIVFGIFPLIAYQIFLVATNSGIDALISFAKDQAGMDLDGLRLPPVSPTWHTLHGLVLLLIFVELVWVMCVSVKKPLLRYITGTTLILTPQILLLPSQIGIFPIEYAIPMSFVAGPMLCIGLTYFFSPSNALSRHGAPKYSREIQLFGRAPRTMDSSDGEDST